MMTMTKAMMTAKFPGTCTVCKLRFPAGTAIVWAKGSGARHALVSGCEAAHAAKAAAPPAPTTLVGEFSGVMALFAEAKKHLKFPKIRLSVAGVPVLLSVAGPKAKFPGSVTIVGEGRYPNRAYYGRVAPDGTWTGGSGLSPAFKAALTLVLEALAKDPAATAKEHGKLLGHCCFCGLSIGHGAEERSVAVGFGRSCAEHYGLLNEWKAGGAEATEAA